MVSSCVDHIGYNCVDLKSKEEQKLFTTPVPIVRVPDLNAEMFYPEVDIFWMNNSQVCHTKILPYIPTVLCMYFV